MNQDNLRSIIRKTILESFFGFGIHRTGNIRDKLQKLEKIEYNLKDRISYEKDYYAKDKLKKILDDIIDVRKQLEKYG